MPLISYFMMNHSFFIGIFLHIQTEYDIIYTNLF